MALRLRCRQTSRHASRPFSSLVGPGQTRHQTWPLRDILVTQAIQVSLATLVNLATLAIQATLVTLVTPGIQDSQARSTRH